MTGAGGHSRRPTGHVGRRQDRPQAKEVTEPATLSKPDGSAPRVQWGDMAKGRATFYHPPVRIMRPTEERTEKAARAVVFCLEIKAARR
jgi:hypothetical protein